MPPERMPRVNELIRQQLGDIILREIELPDESFVTISDVQTAPDLSSATVLVTVVPEDGARTIIAGLQSKAGRLQHELNARVKLRKIPKLKFVHDTGQSKAIRIEELLDQISTTPPPSDGEGHST